MKFDLALLTVTICLTLLYLSQDATCTSDEMSSGAFDGPLTLKPQDEDAAYTSDLDSASRHKRYSAKSFKQDLGFLGAKSIKRQGLGEEDMLRNLAISRLVKRSWKRAPYSGRRMAISRLIKKNREHQMERLQNQDYDIDDLLSEAYPDTFLPQRAIKDAESSKFSAMWKTRVG